jgi:transcriptional regulatory protein LEU3
MALQSLANIPQYIQLIQAVLLLCNWPPPLETIFKDPSLVLCGVAMQLALQHGLHMSDTRQGFELDQLRSEKDHEAARIKAMRGNDGKLWTYCKIVCQRLDPSRPRGRRFG